MSDYQGNIVIKNPATPTGPAENGSAPGIWKLSEAMAFKRQGIWPTQGVVGADPLFSYVSLLLSTTSLGNANNNLLVDSSGAFNPISRFGNATQGSFTPYSPNWSNYFDGTGDYLGNAGSGVLTGDFTIEMWGFFQGFVSSLYTIGTETGQRVGFYITSGGLLAWDLYGAGTTTFSGGVVPLNTWVHIAFVKSSGSITAYLNGASVGTQSMNYTVGNANGFYVGGNGGGMNGYLSNFRVVNGTAVYTANFTPPTAPLTAISGTFLLTCQSNRFRDASSNNFTLTPFGDTRVSDFNPFAAAAPINYAPSDITNWSGYFDGNGDYLSIPYSSAFNMTGNFTVECWVNCLNLPTSSGSGTQQYARIFSFGTYNAANSLGLEINSTAGLLRSFICWYNGTSYTISASNAISTGAWTHIALVRSGTTITLYVNGVSTGTTITGASAAVNTSQPFYIASLQGFETDTNACLNGSVSNFRVVKGAAVYTSNFTPSTSPLTAISGTSLLTLQNAAFTDNSTNNFVITPFGNTTVTGNSPFNTTGFWSNYFDGTDDEVLAPNTPANFGSSNFTAECWVMFTSSTAGYQMVMGNQGSGDGQGWIIYTETNNRLYFAYSTTNSGWAGSIDTGVTPSVNVWTHLAVVRNGTSITFYVNGVASGTPITTSSAIASPSGNFRIGRYPYFPGGARTINAWISNVRLVNGSAVYTTNFTPSTTPLTAVTNTSLLTCQSSRFVDTSANAYAITIGGNPSVQSFDPFYTATIASNAGSMYFDGSDYLTPANGQQLFTLGPTFTLDLWVYLPSAPSVYATIVETRTTANFSSWLLGIWNTGGALRLDAVYAGGRITAASTTVPVGAWTHITFSQVSGVTRLFVNGVADSSTASFVSWDSTSTAPTIGKSVDNYYFLGYMSGLRVVKGSGVSANFTPPTSPVAPTPTTALLLNGMNAGVYDATAINDMETVGNAQVRYPSPFAPANYWAGSFDGSGDYLTVPYSTALQLPGDFTIETWVYLNSRVTSFPCIVSNYSTYGTNGGFALFAGHNFDATKYAVSFNGSFPVLSSTSTITYGVWTHLAVVRSGTTLTLYVNGFAEATATSSATVTGTANNWWIATAGDSLASGYINGSISNLRVVKGTAVYTSNFTPSTTPLTAISGTSLLTCQNKTFIDNSTNAIAITSYGNAAAGAIGPFAATNGTSVYFDGSGDYLNSPNTLAAIQGSTAYTLEAWIYPTTVSGRDFCIYETRGGTGWVWFINGTGYLQVFDSSAGLQTASTTQLSANQWYHVALVRQAGSSTNTYYVNGIAAGTFTRSSFASATQVRIGARNDAAEAFVGYIDELRTTLGVARYTSNFTPPTQAFPTY